MPQYSTSNPLMAMFQGREAKQAKQMQYLQNLLQAAQYGQVPLSSEQQALFQQFGLPAFKQGGQGAYIPSLMERTLEAKKAEELANLQMEEETFPRRLEMAKQKAKAGADIEEEIAAEKFPKQLERKKAEATTLGEVGLSLDAKRAEADYANWLKKIKAEIGIKETSQSKEEKEEAERWKKFSEWWSVLSPEDKEKYDPLTADGYFNLKAKAGELGIDRTEVNEIVSSLRMGSKLLNQGQKYKLIKVGKASGYINWDEPESGVKWIVSPDELTKKELEEYISKKAISLRSKKVEFASEFIKTNPKASEATIKEATKKVSRVLDAQIREWEKEMQTITEKKGEEKKVSISEEAIPELINELESGVSDEQLQKLLQEKSIDDILEQLEGNE